MNPFLPLALTLLAFDSGAYVPLAGPWQTTPNRLAPGRAFFIEYSGDIPVDAGVKWSLQFNGVALRPEECVTYGHKIVKVRDCKAGRYSFAISYEKAGGEDVEHSISLSAVKDDVSATFHRYPYHMPEWVLAEGTLPKEIARIEEWVRDARIVQIEEKRMGVLIDPTFTRDQQERIGDACSLFLEHCLDREVIQNAISRSADNSFNERKGPHTVENFVSQLSGALNRPDRPAVLVVSKYESLGGDGGRGYLNFFNDPPKAKNNRSGLGYFYIALNASSISSCLIRQHKRI